MTFDKWVQLLIPFIALIAAIVSAGLTYSFTKKQQIASEERRLKETAYLDFIEALNHNVMDEDIEEARKALALARNKLLLIADAKVVCDLCKFTDYIAFDKAGDMQHEEHNRLLTNLLKSMRIDLYGKKKINDNYPMVALSGKRRIREAKNDE
jgi:hypothetical protein